MSLLCWLTQRRTYVSFWRFTGAIRSGNAAAISSRVDFPAVRASLKRQLVARFAGETSGHKRWINLGPTLIDAIIDAYVTPEGIAIILANPEALKNLKAPRDFNFTLRRPINAWNVKYASSQGRAVLSSIAMESNFGFILLGLAGSFTISNWV